MVLIRIKLALSGALFLLSKLNTAFLFNLRLLVKNLRKDNLLRLTASFLLLLLLLFPLLLLPLRHDKLVGRDALGDQVEMQDDEVEEEEDKDPINCPTDPADSESRDKVLKTILGGEDSHRYYVDCEMQEGRKDHSEKRTVVRFSDAVIDPHAMVVKVLNATILTLQYRSQARQWRDFSFT